MEIHESDNQITDFVQVRYHPSVRDQSSSHYAKYMIPTKNFF